MSDLIYKDVLKKARADLDFAVREQMAAELKAEGLKARIETLQKTVDGLSILAGETEDQMTDGLGLTDAIRQILSSHVGTGYSATGIRTALREASFPVDGYSNPLSVIHTTLKRLLTGDMVKSWEKTGNGRTTTFYGWLSDEERAARDEETAKALASINEEDIPF